MRRILVVDDDLHTRLAIGIWLKQCGAACERAAEHFERAIRLNCRSGHAAFAASLT